METGIPNIHRPSPGLHHLYDLDWNAINTGGDPVNRFDEERLISMIALLFIVIWFITLWLFT